MMGLCSGMLDERNASTWLGRFWHGAPDPEAGELGLILRAWAFYDMIKAQQNDMKTAEE